MITIINLVQAQLQQKQKPPISIQVHLLRPTIQWSTILWRLAGPLSEKITAQKASSPMRTMSYAP